MSISLLSDLSAYKPAVLPEQAKQLSSTLPTDTPDIKPAEPAMGERAKLTPTEVVEIVQKANKALLNSDANLKFVLDKDSGDRIVQVVDQETQEVLRQIPSVEMLKIAKAIEKMQGVLVSTQA